MKQKYSIIIFQVISLYILEGCKKFIDPGSPRTQLQTIDIFKNDESAKSTIAGLYSKIGSSLVFVNGAEALYGGLSSDELVTTLPNVSYDPFCSNSLESTDDIVSGNLWRPAYIDIYHANAVLAGLENSSLQTPGLKSQLKGEALVIRSMIYYDLATFFGNVPLITNTNYLENAVSPNVPFSVTLHQIIEDLKTAAALLKDISLPNIRAGKYAAIGLLARVCLLNSDWEMAEEKASEIINSGEFSLEAFLPLVFKSNSKETIWQLARDNGNTVLGQSFIPSFAGSLATFRLRDEFLNGFEPNDPRKNEWTSSFNFDGNIYYYPFKYKVWDKTPISECYILLRLAEIYLIRAEARAQQDNLEGALEDINNIRKRAGLSALPVLSSRDSVLMAIEKERKYELFAEGHRWNDIRRTNKADSILSFIKGTDWQSADKLYPIPLSEIQVNPNLSQNPGY